jgi:hypothetical protein
VSRRGESDNDCVKDLRICHVKDSRTILH